MQYYAIVTEKSLSHHGVKGQKWGERNAEWYPIDAYKKHLRNAKDKTKYLNKLDDSMSNDKYDLHINNKKIDNLYRKKNKLDKKYEGNYNQKYLNKVTKIYPKIEKLELENIQLRENIAEAQKAVNKTIMQFVSEGLTIESKSIKRTAYKGEALVKDSLGAIGSVVMSRLNPAGVGIGIIGNNKVYGMKYKVKETEIQKPKPKLESPVKTFEDVYGKQDKKETKEQIISKTSKIPEHNSALNIDDNVKKNIEKVLNKSGTPENKAYKERLKEYKNWNTGKYSDEQLKKMAKADASEETASYIQYLQDCGLSAQKIHEKYGYSIDTIRSAMSW